MEKQKEQQPSGPISDGAIIDLFWHREEEAIRATDQKYRVYLFSLAGRFVEDPQDREECLNDVYLGVWNAIPPTRPTSLKAFLTVLLRRAAVNRYQKRVRKKAIPSEMTVSLTEMEGVLSGLRDVEDEVEMRRLSAVISTFVRELPPRQRYIFVGRYYLSAPIDTLAGELTVSRSTVNKELAAVRSQLKETLEKEGFA